MGRCDARIQLVLRKRRPARFALAPMIVGVEFDDVGTAGDLVADSFYSFVDACDFLRPLRNRNAGLKSLGSIGAAGDDRLGRDEQARTRRDPLVDRLL